MAVTMAEISKLRKLTGAGMMDCKNALTETNGDIEAAKEIIRKKGQAVAAKREDREAAEGCVVAKAEGAYAAIVALKCETDFVAKNESFIALTNKILDAAMAAKAKSRDEVLALTIDGSDVASCITDEIGKTGEKMELGDFEYIEAPYTTAYIHPGNKLATIVGFNIADTDYQVAHDVAMQVAAMNPIAVRREEVPAETIEKEMEIGREKARQEGKPENILDRIAEGRLHKFFQEYCLVDQAFVKEPKETIQQYMSKSNKELTVTAFRRFTLNEE
ncbi:MAG TPA: translation elongation factor Ts [Candidatus Barnesiella excrementipullorum]|uniref:Elongation factor Ts n=1 Tax=Candidatus Barnesiella excrementipullorum TaxID=2838479 RepID=A0A9D1VQM5_9BACT|nr:translation elongation factor Ts [Candidatus Barnesiella excrementipullorum]